MMILIFISMISIVGLIQEPYSLISVKTSSISNSQNVEWSDDTLIDLESGSDEYETYNVESDILSETSEYDGTYSFDNQSEIEGYGYYYSSPNSWNDMEAKDYTSNPSEIEWIDYAVLNDDSTLFIIDKFDEHKNVLEFKADLDSVSYLKHYITQSFEGSFSFYVGVSNSLYTFDILIREGNTVLFRLRITNYNFYYYDNLGNYYIQKCKANTLYYVQIDIRNDDTFDMYIDNDLVVDNKILIGSMSSGFDNFAIYDFVSFDNYYCYLDSYIDTIDGIYDVYQNLYQEIEISENDFYETNVSAFYDTEIQFDDSYNSHDYVLHLNDSNDSQFNQNDSESIYPLSSEFDFTDGNFSSYGNLEYTDSDYHTIQSSNLVANGTYSAEYSFTYDVSGYTPESWSNGIVYEYLDNHSKILKLSDYEGTSNSFSDKESGVLELWVYSNDVSYGTLIILYDDSNAGVNLGIYNEQFYYHTTSNNYVLTIYDDTWYHLLIDFDCTTDTFDWVIKDSYENVLYSDTSLAFDTPIDYVNELFLYSYLDSVFFDAIDFSWSGGYSTNRNYYPVEYTYLISVAIEYEISRLENYDNQLVSLILEYAYAFNVDVISYLRVYNYSSTSWVIINDTDSIVISENSFELSSDFYDDNGIVLFSFIVYDDSNSIEMYLDKFITVFSYQSDLGIELTSDLDDTYLLEFSYWIYATNSCYLSFYDIYDNLILKVKFTENSTNIYLKESTLYYESILNKWINLYFYVNVKTETFSLKFNYVDVAVSIDFYDTSIYYSKISYFIFQTDLIGNFYLDAFDDSTFDDYEYQRNFYSITEYVEYNQVDNLEFDYNELEFEYNLTRFEQQENTTVENNVYVDNVNGLGSSLYILSNSTGSGSNGVIWNVENNDTAFTLKMTFTVYNLTNQNDYVIFSLTPFGTYDNGNQNGTLDFKFQLDSENDLYLWMDIDFSNTTNWQKVKKISMDVENDLSLYVNFVDYYYKFVINSYTIKPFIYNFDSSNNVSFDDNFGTISQISFYYNYYDHSYVSYSYFELESISLKNKNGGNAYSTTISEYASFAVSLDDWDTNEYNLVSDDISTPSISELIDEYTSSIPYYDDISDDLNELQTFIDYYGTLKGYFMYYLYKSNVICDNIADWIFERESEYNELYDDYISGTITIVECINQIQIDDSFLDGTEYSLDYNTVNLYRELLSSSNLESSSTYTDCTYFIKLYNYFEIDTPSLKIHKVSVITEGNEYDVNYEYSSSSKANYFEVIDGTLTWKYSKTSKNDNDESMSISVYVDDLQISNQSVMEFVSLINNNYSGSIILYSSDKEIEIFFNGSIVERSVNISSLSSSSNLKSSGTIINKIKVKLQALASNITSFFTGIVKNFASGLLSALSFFTNQTEYELETMDVASFQEGLVLALVYLTLFLFPSFIIYKLVGANSFTIIWLLILLIFFIIGQFPIWMSIIQAFALIGMFIVNKDNENESGV